MFLKVKNARTLLWLHLGILQHLEDGKKKTRGNHEHHHQQLVLCYLSAYLPNGLQLGNDSAPLASTPHFTLVVARSPHWQQPAVGL